MNLNYKITLLKPFGVLITPKDKSYNIKNIEINYLRELFWKHQLLVLRGFQTFIDSEDFSDYCDRWGEVALWPFGKVLELVEQKKPEDHIFDNSYVPLHWDGMYRPQIPEYQIFHCLKSPQVNQGGRTIFSNTISTLKSSISESKELWRKVTGNYQREMEFYNSKTISPIITKHPLRDFSVLRYNEPHSTDKGHFINPPQLNFSGVSSKELEKFHHTIKEELYNSKNLYAHKWQKKDIIIADNFSLLHGRDSYISQSPRHLQRVQVLSNPPYDNPNLESFQ